METAFALLYWPVLGIVLMLIAWYHQQKVLGVIGWLLFGLWFVTASIPLQFVQDFVHVPNFALRMLCGPVTGWHEELLSSLLRLSSLIPLIIWRYKFKKPKAFASSDRQI